ncbi:MAG: hypothetical protein ACTSRK_10775 [Promethearchaeota archaeon]
MKIRSKKKENLINRVIIGLGYGLVKTKDLILNKEMGIAPQDAMDALSVWIGREIMKELLEKNIVKVADSDEVLVDALTSVINIAEELDIDYNHAEKKLKVIVQKCEICPKRVGGYDLEGETSCPVGGLLTGALAYARGSSPLIAKNHLQTGEICHIEIDV